MADRVLVMYAGRKIEEQPVGDLIEAPVHPYTKALLAARPQLNRHADRSRRLNVIPGAVPPLGEWPQGCTFAPRCAFAVARCRSERPEQTIAGSLTVACHLAQNPPHEAIRREVANA
jgi:peptide/nickel transport system ATP-binding protein